MKMALETPRITKGSKLPIALKAKAGEHVRQGDFDVLLSLSRHHPGDGFLGDLVGGRVKLSERQSASLARLVGMISFRLDSFLPDGVRLTDQEARVLLEFDVYRSWLQDRSGAKDSKGR